MRSIARLIAWFLLPVFIIFGLCAAYSAGGNKQAKEAWEDLCEMLKSIWREER